MGQCNSTEGIQAPPPAGTGPNNRTALPPGAPQPSVQVHAPPPSQPLQPLQQPSSRKALPLAADEETSPSRTPQARPSTQPRQSRVTLAGPESSDMAVSRSPHSILKVPGKSRKQLPSLNTAPSARFSHNVSDTETSPHFKGEHSESGDRTSARSKVRLALPDEEPRPSKAAAPAQAAPLVPPARRMFDHSQSWVFKETQDVNKFYTFGKVLGQGQFGTTRLVTELATEGQYACKSISKKKLKREDEVEDVKREVQILHHLEGHPNIIRIKDVFEDRRHVHIVMELASGGELFERMSKKGRYSEKDAAAVFRKMVAVVVHCHNMGVMHRDLKPENFLLMSDDADAQLKATDFGLSTFFREGQKFTEIVGSALYVAPEVLKREYSKEADMWSLGVILYILLSGTPPFMAETEEKVFRKVLRSAVDMRSKPWPLISEDAKDCVRSMLERDPSKRASAQQILSHPWVKEDGVATDKPMQFEVLVRLQGFSAMNKLKKEAVKIIASLMPEDEIIGLREIFKSIDTDNSGAISIAELRDGLLRKGTVIPDEQLKLLMQYVDINGNGNLDYDEFIAATLNQSKIEQDAYLVRAFQQFDTDNSGYITQDELFKALTKHNVPLYEINAILRQVDQDGDGRIDYEEFCTMMRHAEQLDHIGDTPPNHADQGRGHGANAVRLNRQSSDFVRPSWSVHGGSRGDHLLTMTAELDVVVQRTSLMRAISKKRRSSLGDSVSAESRSFKGDRADSGAPSLQPKSEASQASQA